VYLHRQSQKHRILAPLVVLLPTGAFVYYLANLKALYPQALEAMGRALSTFSVSGQPGDIPGWVNDLASNTGMMWMMLLVLGALVVTYLLQGVEWALYRLGV
jgi:hypothetical protein